MAVIRKAESYHEELRELAEGLPFAAIDLPAARDPKWIPVRVRQPRTYTHPDSSMQAIGRFLVERGTVELLGSEKTLDLFNEIHWCAAQVRELAAKRPRIAETARTQLVAARGFLSRIEEAEEELFIANRRLVVNCVKPYFWIGQVWLADFLQEGSKALANAVRKFDHTRGTPFYSYAQKSIQNRLRNFFRDHVRAGSFGIRPNREMQLVKSIIETWRRDYGEEPTDEAVAKIADLPLERVTKARAFVRQWEHMPAPPVSLDALINEDGSSMYEVIEDVDAVDAAVAAGTSEVWAAVDMLPERSRHIMKLRFRDGRTLEETGQLLKLTRARIKQIQDASLKKVRQLLNTHRPG